MYLKSYLFLGLFASILLISCNRQPLSKNEQKGVDEILRLYGGACNYSAITRTTSKGTTHQFNLELSKSSVIEQLSGDAEIPCSNIAYTFYKNLQNEATAYNVINATLALNDGKKISLNYSTTLLALIKDKSMTVDSIIYLIKEKRFDDLKNMLDDSSYLSYNKDTLVQKIQAADPTFGSVTGYNLYGFKFEKANSSKSILHILVIIKRDKLNNKLSVFIDPATSSIKALAINYKF